MNKIKKLFILILSAITLLCAALGLVGCKNKDNAIELVGFSDVTVEGALYEDFSVSSYVMVVDTEDNVYKGTVEVTDHENNPVELTFNRFELNSLNPYTIKVSVQLPSGEVKTRVITIEVKDKSAPKFTYSSKLYTGTVGSVYTLPSVTATKVTGDVLEPTIKVYFIDGGSEKEQTITDGKFTPQQAGKYTLRSTAIDKYNDEYVNEKTIVVRPQMPEKMLEDFGHANSVENATGGLNFLSGPSTGTYLTTKTDSEETTANGVVAFSIWYSNQVAAGRFNKTQAELTEIIKKVDAITLHFMIEREGFEEFAFRFFGVQQTVPVGKWTAICVSKEQIFSKMQGATEEEKIADFANAYSVTGSGVSKGGCRIFGAPIGDMTGKGLPVWVDAIYLGMPEFAENVLDDYTYGLSTNNVASGAVNFAQDRKGTHYASFTDGEGTVANGVVYGQMWYTNQVLPVRFNRTESELLSIMQDLKTLTVRLLVKHGEDQTIVVKLFGVAKEIPTNKWTEISVTRSEILYAMSGATQEEKIAKFAENFCSTGSGDAPRLFSASIAGSGVSLDMYFDSITFEKKEIQEDNPYDPSLDDVYIP